MSDDTIDAAELGHELDLDDFALPPDVAANLGTLFGTDPLETAGEWVGEMRAVKQARDGRLPTAEDLCTTDDGRHAFVGSDHRQEYVCVLDPLVVPFLRDEPGTVRSTTPVWEETVEIGVAPDGVARSHADAVVSIGVSDHVDPEADPTLERIYRQVCGYVHVFADDGEYEVWADDVDAATTSVPVSTGIALAGALATTLFEERA
ncbi:alkylmercury lyase family protein [Halomicroarcula sp. F13]|uniref:Alkylmercury lyase family protein n=1 Tax=Haloarcula rubra TaxID=2487747 RepID=A0AAW4PMR0_9EURY|nr:organomercurial lyase [Halomicroarcula rubra]MBX0321718.1 alkylmercury lyase family protein [Halomicroarcula rubra]